MKRITVILSVALSLILIMLSVSIIAFAAKERTLADGYVSILDYGAESGTDCTEAFKKAVAAGKNIYIPKGSYYIKDSIVLDGIKMVGSNLHSSKIIGTSSEPNYPLVIIEGTGAIQDIYLAFTAAVMIEGFCSEGEFVAIQTGSENKPTQSGSYIRNIVFDHVGTAIYSPKGKNTGANGLLIETIEVMDYYYRGIDMQTENRIGNTYSNMYINRSDTDGNVIETPASSGFALEGSEYGAVINQLNIEHSRINEPMILKNQYGFSISSLHFEGVHILKNDTGMINIINSDGYIGAMVTFFTKMTTQENSLINFGETERPCNIKLWTLGYRGLNRPNQGLYKSWPEAEKGCNVGAALSMKILDRENGTKGDFNITVEHVSYYAYTNAEKPYLDAFGCDNTLNYTVNSFKEDK